MLDFLDRQIHKNDLVIFTINNRLQRGFVMRINPDQTITIKADNQDLIYICRSPQVWVIG